MCSILGGTKFDAYGLMIYTRAKDRGRDYSGLSQMGDYWIANHRATPTNELEAPIQNQPFGQGFKIVHNGTIANDGELGVSDDAIDSSVLARCIDVENIQSVGRSLKKVVGSYAIAILKEKEIILACNYKPIFFTKIDGEFYFSSLKSHLTGHIQRVKPYSVMNLTTGESVDLPRYQPDKALIVCSGGLDSVSLIGYAQKRHQEIKLIHFDYGCRATNKEIEAIKSISKEIGCEYDILNIDYSKFQGSATLFQDEEIESGKDGVEYALDWVYARNLVMLSIATAYAEANQYGYIYLGSNLEESGAYPDNEEQFIRDFNSLLYGAVNNGYKVEIVTPLGGLMKREIVDFGLKHDSPLHLSWSCYNGGEKHCGKCGPCYMRKKAFKRAGEPDPTIYEDRSFDQI